MSFAAFEAPTFFNAIIVGALDYSVHMLRNTANGTAFLPGGFSIESRTYSAVVQGIMAFFAPQIKKAVEYVIPVSARAAAAEQAIMGPIGKAAGTFVLNSLEFMESTSGLWPIQRTDMNDYGDAIENAVQSLGVQSIGLQATRVAYPLILGKPIPPELM